MHATEAEIFLDWVSDEINFLRLRWPKQDFIIDTFKTGLLSHPETCHHEKNVTLLVGKVAKNLKEDEKAAGLGALLHDTGKFMIPSELSDGRKKITHDQYNKILKLHPMYSRIMLNDHLLFSSFIGGTHHCWGKGGYGLTLEDLPEWLSVDTKKKVRDVSIIVSVADYIEASVMRRDLKLMDGSDAPTLQESLRKKYPSELTAVIEASLRCAREMGWAVW